MKAVRSGQGEKTATHSMHVTLPAAIHAWFVKDAKAEGRSTRAHVAHVLIGVAKDEIERAGDDPPRRKAR